MEIQDRKNGSNTKWQAVKDSATSATSHSIDGTERMGVIKFMGLFKKSVEHDFGDELGTCPNVRKCKKCGLYQQVSHPMDSLILDDFGTAHLSDLPLEIFTNMAGAECEAVAVYTKYEFDDALEAQRHRSWADGQNSGIHLQPEFSKLFFEKIRLNPDRMVYEIPQESYQTLKDYITKI